MDKTAKHKWVNALKSGEFKQGVGLLYNSTNKTHCSIGVLCRVFHKVRYNNDMDKFIYESYGFIAHIPPLLQDDLKLDDEDVQKVMRMNDSHINTFEEIADWIERNL